MSIQPITIGMLAIACGLGSVSSAWAATGKAPTVDEIVDRAVQNVYSGNEQSIYGMKLLGPEGGGEKLESSRKMKVAFRRLAHASKLLIRFQEPADIRGTAVLSLSDQE